jgi:RNA polymerase sigma-70 factor, ECF subfamily
VKFNLGVSGLVKINNSKDSELLLKVAGYDMEALESLYDRYSPALYSFIKKMVSEKELAESILVDVFKILWSRIDDFDFRTNNVFTWMFTLARNKSLDTLKRKKVNCDLPPYNDEYEKLHIVPDLSQEIEALEMFEVMKLKNDIKEGFDKLTEAQRFVLNLVYFEGMSETEIAEQLHIPAPTVRSKLQVAMNNLYEKLIKVN